MGDALKGGGGRLLQKSHHPMFLRLVSQLSDSGFDPDDWLQLAQIFQVRCCLASPTSLASYADRPPSLICLTTPSHHSHLLHRTPLSRASCTYVLA